MYVDICTKYEWLVQLLRTEFPDCEFVCGAFDFNNACAISISHGEGETRKRHAVRTEYSYPVGGTWVESEDGGELVGAVWHKYSINELSAEDKTETVAKIIAAFRKFMA